MYPERKTTGSAGSRARSRLASSVPGIPGITTSVTTRFDSTPMHRGEGLGTGGRLPHLEATVPEHARGAPSYRVVVLDHEDREALAEGRLIGKRRRDLGSFHLLGDGEEDADGRALPGLRLEGDVA